MNKLPKDKRDRLILVILGAIVVTAGLYYGLISWQRTSLKGLQQKAAAAAAKADQAERLLKSADLVYAELEQNRMELQRIEEGMAPENNVYAWIVNTLSTFRLTRHGSVTISSFSQPEVGGMQMIPEFPYQGARFLIACTAEYTEIGRFIADFENSFPYARIQSLDLEPLPGNPAGSDGQKLAVKLEAIAPVRAAQTN